MKLRNISICVAFALGLGSAASAATVSNGGFEAASFQGNWQTYGAGSSSLTGWNIDRGSIDLINAYWQHAGGSYSIDLDGSSPATISQTIDNLIVGQRYILNFSLASNGTSTRGVNAQIGATSDEFVFDGAGTTYSNMGWLKQELEFTAEDTSLLLSFASTTPGNSVKGVALDNISISAVPLPAGMPLLLAGLGGIIALKRRKKAA